MEVMLRYWLTDGQPPIDEGGGAPPPNKKPGEAPKPMRAVGTTLLAHAIFEVVAEKPFTTVSLAVAPTAKGGAKEPRVDETACPGAVKLRKS